MGVDLQIFASNFRERRGEILSTATLRFDRDARLLSLLTKEAVPCLVQPLPPGTKVGHCEDQGLKFDENDRQGEPLTFTTSDRLRALRRIDDLSEWNRAIVAFMLVLPPETKIILYWC